MKALTILLIAVMIFTSVPAFACGGSCGGDKDKDKDKSTLMLNAQYLCGDGEKSEPNLMCSSCGCKKDKDCDKPKPEPKPEPEPKPAE